MRPSLAGSFLADGRRRQAVKYTPDGPAAVLSPHLDDAVLSAWSVLRRAGDVRVVNVCTGVPPPGPPPSWDLRTGATDRRERMGERLAEDSEALAHAGREPTGLGFLDAHYRTQALDPDALAQAIADAVPLASQLWAPAAIGGHMDHVQVRQAAFELAGRGGPPIRLYADLPYAVRIGWPEWVDGGPHANGLHRDFWWNSDLPADGPLPAAAHELPSREIDRKLRALEAYRTQWRGLVRSFPLLARRQTLRYEVSFDAGSIRS